VGFRTALCDAIVMVAVLTEELKHTKCSELVQWSSEPALRSPCSTPRHRGECSTPCLRTFSPLRPISSWLPSIIRGCLSANARGGVRDLSTESDRRGLGSLAREYPPEHTHRAGRSLQGGPVRHRSLGRGQGPRAGAGVCTLGICFAALNPAAGASGFFGHVVMRPSTLTAPIATRANLKTCHVAELCVEPMDKFPRCSKSRERYPRHAARATG
jgi:hypothetical protein